MGGGDLRAMEGFLEEVGLLGQEDVCRQREHPWSRVQREQRGLGNNEDPGAPRHLYLRFPH